MSIITIKKAASVLSVSEATVRNWIRCGYLEPTPPGRNQFESEKVALLKAKIEKGEISRLRNRANKRQTDVSFIPDEYIQDASFIHQIEDIQSIFLENHLDLETSLFVLALRQLGLIGEVSLASSCVIELSSYSKWKRQCVKDEICSWHGELPTQYSATSPGYLELYNALLDISHDDTIGIVYQSLLSEGRKSQNGAYYTPIIMIDEIFRDHLDKTGKLLDPCCGTGQFLIRAVRAGHAKPTHLYGFDIDKLAVRIARLNLLMICREKQFKPNVEHADTLTEVASGNLFCNTNALKGSFELIATNPPWGGKLRELDSSSYKKTYPTITSGETFSMFLVKALELTREGGRVSFILPESILNIKCHSDIRQFLLNNTVIKEIQHLGRRFKGVFTEVVRMDLVKSVASDKDSVLIKNTHGENHSIPQSRFIRNDNSVFDSTLSEIDHDIISMLKSMPHVSLQANADWALGIVTGNNKKYLSDVREEGMEPIFRGSDVEQFRLQSPKFYFHFKPELFQQVAPESKYRVAEKLVYRFISKRLVFAYDSTASLTLNSANICIPELEDYPLKLILGLFNSKLYQFVFGKLFHTHKVLKGDLERLPLPLLPDHYRSKIIDLVDQAIEGHDTRDILDLLIMESVGLSQVQVRTVLDWE